MIAVALLLLAVAGWLSVSATRDLFSPSKFYLLMFATFHVGICFFPYSLETWMLVLLVLMVGAMTAVFESQTPARRAAPKNLPVPMPVPVPHRALDKRLFLVLWLISAGPIAAQLYMVQTLGGIEAYINSIGMRVLEWRGLGFLTIVIGMMAPLNFVYFAAGLTRKRSVQWWALYGIHLGLLLALAAMTASRSGFLNTFIMMAFVYHYVKKPLNPALVTIAGVAILSFALVLGAARNNFGFDNDGFRTGLETSESIYEKQSFLYGVTPLDIIVENGPHDLAYGGTFATVFTNFIPRQFWPDKPETGGVVLTKVYTGDAWAGASNLAPTFLGEFIINFGWAGIALYLVIYPLMMFLLVRRYRTVLANLRAERSARAVMDLIIYLTVMTGFVALMIGEFTNVIFIGIISKVIPVFILKRWYESFDRTTTKRPRRAPMFIRRRPVVVSLARRLTD